jgi:hypothetical protein
MSARILPLLTICLLPTAISCAQGADRAAVDFDNDVQPILTRQGCNQGVCHGKARGQGGFQLSLLGFDSNFDHDAITKEARGRRIFAGAPERSLLLMKPTGQVPHGGGVRLKTDSREYELMLQWIQQGIARRVEGAPALKSFSVTPDSVVLKNEQQQPLKTIALYDDGSTRDVTSLTVFQSNEAPIAAVTEDGMVTAGSITGSTAIMARFMGRIATCSILIPSPVAVPANEYTQLPVNNFIDKLVWQRLQQLNITPSKICGDHVFLRRATTDLCGRIPTPKEVQEFLEDESADKRQQLVNRLVQEPDFADHWANKWMDLLRPNPYHVGIKTVMSYDHWIRERFHQRMPWDQFVRELVTARGGTWRNGAVTLFRDRRTPDEITTLVSQLFVGVRLECCKCHHHPFEKWSQDDFFSFAAYFGRMGRKGSGISAPISGSEEFIFAGKGGSVSHPRTGKTMEPKPLWGEAVVTADTTDPREVLAEWITSPNNHLFAQVMANRVWADLMGRGLVEPVDDFRATNPATNQPLLDALGNHFRDTGFSLAEFMKTITASHVYQLDSLPNERNIADTRNYSRHYRHRLRAEVLLDAFVEVSGIPRTFGAMPPGTKAKQIWTHRTTSLFLDTFGRPDPNQDPPCERTKDSAVVQALHLMNSEQMFKDIQDNEGVAARLAASESRPSEIAEQLYRLIYGRNPVAEEIELVNNVLNEENADRRQSIEDFMWAMINTPEFVFQD